MSYNMWLAVVGNEVQYIQKKAQIGEDDLNNLRGWGQFMQNNLSYL